MGSIPSEGVGALHCPQLIPSAGYVSRRQFLAPCPEFQRARCHDSQIMRSRTVEKVADGFRFRGDLIGRQARLRDGHLDSANLNAALIGLAGCECEKGWQC